MRFLQSENRASFANDDAARVKYLCGPPRHQHFSLRIGSQADPTFLKAVVAEMGGVDIVLDDGSHVAAHQRTSFSVLWPLLNVGGLYIIEDLHSSYWPQWGGGLRRPGSGVELVKSLIDDMHAWFHDEDESLADRRQLGVITIGNSIAAIQKIDGRLAPGHYRTGVVAD